MNRAQLLRLTRGPGGAPIVTPTPILPAIVLAPSFSGAPTSGLTLTGTNGVWSNTPVGYTYQHQSSADGLTGWTDIPGATAKSLALNGDLIGVHVRPGVSAFNAAGAAVFAYGAAVGPVVEGSAADYVATSAAELITHVNSAIAAGGNKTIEISDAGSFGTTIIDLKNKDPAARVVIRGQSVHGVEVPGFDLEGSSNLTIKDLRAKRLRVVVGTAADATAGVFRVHGTADVWFENCDISADPMTTFDAHGYMSVSGGAGTFIDGENVVTSHSTPGTGVYKATAPMSAAGVFAITGPATVGNRLGGSFSTAWSGKTLTGVTSGATRTIGSIVSNINLLVGITGGTTPCSGLKVTNCDIHDVKWGVAVNGTDVEVVGNDVFDFYISPFDFNGDCSGLRLKANRFFGGWAIETDGEPSGTNGPHSSVGGFSFGDKMPDDIEIEGNILGLGRNRFNATGEQAQGTGNKVNDMACTATGSISGTVMTVASTPSLSFTLKVGMRVFGTGVADNTVITAILTGTGKIGTYSVNNSQTVASTTLEIQARVTNLKYRSNLIDSNASIGTQMSYLGAGCEYAYNTHVSCRDTRSATNPNTPSFYFSDCDSGLRAHHNVVMSLAVGGLNHYIHPDVYRDSVDNVIALMTATTGPASFEALFDGIGGPLPFSGATIDNFREMFAPKAGSRIETGYGHTAYYDWDTREASYPVLTMPSTSVPTGVDLPAVAFDGVNDFARYTVSGAETLLSFSTGNAITIVLGVRMQSANTVDGYLMRAQNSDILVRRLNSAGNKLRVSFKGADGNTCVSFDTTLGLSLADTSVVLLTISIDFANYRYHVMKGKQPDTLLNINTWTGAAMRVTSDTFTLMATDTGGSKLAGDVTCLYVHDGFWDGLDADNHDLLIAQDGKPVSLGANGSLLLGVQPRVYAKGAAAAWNDAGGVNLGSAARKLIVTGALVDA